MLRKEKNVSAVYQILRYYQLHVVNLRALPSLGSCSKVTTTLAFASNPFNPVHARNAFGFTPKMTLNPFDVKAGAAATFQRTSLKKVVIKLPIGKEEKVRI